jgi:nicotinamidase-related amidase
VTDTPPTIDPQRTALLVMDYQPAILGNLADADALLARAGEAIAIARKHGAHVGYVRVAFEDADYAAVPATNKMFARLAGGGFLRAEDPESAVHGDVAPEPGDIIVRKTRVGAFSTTDLDDQLRARGITTLVLAGISTSGVVLSTVREAADRDYQLYILADACADPDNSVHETLLQKVFPRQADVITVGDLRAVLAGS